MSRKIIVSPREREILAALVQGHPNKVIARDLGIAEATVKVHCKMLFRRLSVSNRTQAAMWAVTHLPEYGAFPHADSAQ